MIGDLSSSGRSLTCDQTLAGVPSGHSVDPVGRERNLVPSVLDGDGVASRYVRYIGHRVSPVPVVPDVGLLGFSLRVLVRHGQEVSGLNGFITGLGPSATGNSILIGCWTRVRVRNISFSDMDIYTQSLQKYSLLHPKGVNTL